MIDPSVPHLADAALERLREAQAGKVKEAAFSTDLSVNELILIHEAGFEPLGLVMGSSIYHIGYQFAGLSQSQELGVLSHALYEARNLAMQRMEGEAHAQGADGIVGVKLEIGEHEWGNHMTEFVAIGTAIKARSGNFKTNQGRPFTSDLSGQDFWTLMQSGHRPLGLVMGTCVYHIAYQGIGSWFNNMGKNVELPNFTSAIYEARELAMGRMQAEAEAHGAEGVVGVQVKEGSFAWGGHTIEFFAVGTAVVPISAEHEIPTPKLALSIDS